MKIAVIGFGARGQLYTSILQKKGVTISAICDKDTEKLNLAKKIYNLDDDKLFNDEEQFFKQGTIADLLLVCTQDKQHFGHAKKALECGYNILLEKPIAVSINECEELLRIAKECNRYVFVCHVLRYSPFFSIIKDQLNTGNYGKVININLTENVGYWHQAHSYVRGNWRNDKSSTPMLIAKSCHDLDLISWFIGEKCEAVSSFGSLSYFTEKNAPKDSADYCLKCKYVDDCVYSAKKFYITNRVEKGRVGWPCNVVVPEPTTEKMYKALETSQYGRCVYKCDNNVVDHQVVNMRFKGDVTAHLTMTAFSQCVYREIHVHCEKGEIYGSMIDNILHCKIFGKSSETIDTNNLVQDTAYGHGGGDVLMMEDIYSFLNGEEPKALTSIENSMQSHIIGFNAELSRLNGGKIIELV